MGRQIFIVGKGTLTLQQAEATGVGVYEGTDLERLRVEQRPPQPFLLPIPDGQAIRVMRGWAKVINANTIIGTKEEHARQRRQANTGQFDAWIERHFDIDHRWSAWANGKAIRPGRTVAIQERMDHNDVGLWTRPLDPERAKDRELLSIWGSGVERQPTGR